MIVAANPNDCYGNSPCLYRTKSTPDQPVHRHNSTNIVQSGIEDAGLLGVGILLHRVPPRLPGDGLKTILPADWKVWAKVLLGIAAVRKVNQALNWSPPPWLGALEAIAIINPLVVGLSRSGVKQMVIMAPIIALVVQCTSLLKKTFGKPIHEQTHVPSPLIQWGISLLCGFGVLLAYPRLHKSIASTGLIGKTLKAKAENEVSAFAGSTFTTCARGCSPGSFICLSETAEVLGSFGQDAEESAEESENPDPIMQDPMRHIE